MAQKIKVTMRRMVSFSFQLSLFRVGLYEINIS